jgi:hypothetical protein
MAVDALMSELALAPILHHSLPDCFRCPQRFVAA